MPARTGHTKRPRPVFVIGSYRSGTSVMTWALGQHPNLFPLEETHFIYRLAIDLDYLYAAGSEPGLHSFIGSARLTPRQFRAPFGDACAGLIESSRQQTITHANSEEFRDKRSANITLTRSEQHPKRRWIDGTPENAHYVLPLLRLFPEAKFIHVLRNPKQVATSLMHFSSAGGQDYAEDEAFGRWIHMVRACALAEEALGPKRILRVGHQDIVADPQAALQRCLAFVGEDFHPDCLLPLREKINSSIYDDLGDDSIETNIGSSKPWTREAFRLYRDLLEGSRLTTGRLAAFRVLHRNAQERRRQMHPAEDDRPGSASDQTTTQSKPARSGLRILNWGPRDIVAGKPFNVQPDGSNALWIATSNAPLDVVAEANGIPLKSFVQKNGALVAAVVPARLTSQPGRLAVMLRSASTGETAGPLICKPLPDSATIHRLLHRAQGAIAGIRQTGTLSRIPGISAWRTAIDHGIHRRRTPYPHSTP